MDLMFCTKYDTGHYYPARITENLVTGVAREAKTARAFEHLVSLVLRQPGSFRAVHVCVIKWFNT